MPAHRTLLAIAADPDGPVVRHRALAYRLALAREGVVLEVAAWPKGFLARRALLERARKADGVWVLARLLTVRHVTRLRERAKKLLFDFDDALPFRDSARGAGRSLTRTRRFRAIVRAADAVSAGNPYLASLAQAEGAKPVVLPTTVVVEPGPPEPEPPMPPPVLGWIGTRSTLPYLVAKTVPLAAVVATGTPFRLRVVADAVPTMPPGIPVEGIRWTKEGEGAALDGMHVGLAPLPDDAWTRGKCGLKVVQMLSRGRPVVASPVGVQRQQVRHGTTGFLAAGDEDVLIAIQTLLRDEELRRRMGAAAKEDVRARWSVDAWTERVVAFVAGALVILEGTPTPRRVVVRLPNPAGDVVLATPALRGLRRGLPDAHVTWAGRPGALALLEGLEERDAVLSISGPLDRGLLAPWRLGRAYRESGADAIVVLPDSLSSALAARASRVPVRVGYARRGRGPLLSDALPFPTEGGRPIPHPMRERYMRLMLPLGAVHDGFAPRLALTVEGVAKARERLARAGAAGKAYWAVSPGAAFGPSKVYPPRLVADAVSRVRAATGLVPLVLCGPGEEALAAETASRIGDPVIATHDDVARWPEAKALLAGARLLLSPDAGPRHVAAALGTPVVTILGPTDPRWSMGDQALVTVLRKEGLPCLACHEKACPIAGHPCMETLDPAEVAAACLARIAAPRPAAR